jgi:ABC-type nitrate/sulfonate/bicarbonate transport system substrate-binding protein
MSKSQSLAGILLVALSTSLLACDRRPTTLTKVHFLIDWKADTTYAGVYVAKAKGFYSKRGIDLEISEGNGAMTAASVLGAGSSYFIGTCSGEATVIARSKGVPIKSVAVYYHDVPTVLYSRTERAIRLPADMIGKRIGLVDGSIGVYEFRAVVAANNLDLSKIQTVSIGWDPAPLLAGKVDGQQAYAEAEPVQLTLQGHSIVIMRYADFGLKSYSLNLIVNEDALSKHAAEIRSIVEATTEGYQLVMESPDAAAQEFCSLFPEKNREFIRASMRVVAGQLRGQAVGTQTRQGWQATIDTLRAVALVLSNVTVEQVAPEDYLVH